MNNKNPFVILDSVSDFGNAVRQASKKEILDKQKKLTFTLSHQDVLCLARLIQQDLESMKKYEGGLGVTDRLAEKFGNKFLPKLLKFLDIKE